MLEYIDVIMKYVLPALPYAGVSLVTYQIMAKFIKPMIVAHRSPEGLYPEGLWRNLRRGMVFYPMVLGALCALPFPGLSWGYGVVAAASSQVWYVLAKQYLAKQGLVVPEETEGDPSFPPEDEEPTRKIKKSTLMSGLFK